MKVHVLKDKNGKVIATFEPTTAGSVRLEPQVAKGHKVEQAELPRNYVSQLDILYKKTTARKKKAR